MNPLTEMPNVAPAGTTTLTKWILFDHQVKGSVLLAGPGEEFLLPDNQPGTESYLIVLSGEVTVCSGTINTMLRTEEAVRLMNDQPRFLSNRSSAWARLLRLDVVVSRAPEPPIVTFPN